MKYRVSMMASETTATVVLTAYHQDGKQASLEVLVDVDLRTGRVLPSALLVDKIAREVDPSALDLAETAAGGKLTRSIVYSEHDDMFGYDDYLVYVDETDEYVHPFTAEEQTYVSKGNRKWKTDEWTGEEHRA